MDNLLSTIRQLKERGDSMREIAAQLSISKYEVEKAFQQLKALGQRPDNHLDNNSDDCLDYDSDNRLDEEMPVSGEFALAYPAKGRSPKDLPSTWCKGVTRSDADFIIEHYLKNYDPSQIKACYMRKYTSGFMSLEDIHQVVEAYESRVVRVRQQEESRKQELKIAAKKAADEQLLEQFNNFIGEEALTFLLWFDECEECEIAELKSCVAIASSILSEIEDFCRKHKLKPQHYEPYMVISDIKDAISKGIRKQKEPDLGNKVISFLGMINRRSSLDRYFRKMVDCSVSQSMW